MISSPEEVDMTDDYYQFATKEHFWIKARFNAAMRNDEVKSLRNKRLLEIGCGNGVVMNQLEEKYQTIVDGCDLNMFALEQVGEVNGRLFCLNIFDRPKELLGSYDGILLMDVIEHIEDHVEFLKTCAEYLKEGGFILINVPALNSLFSEYDVLNGHKRRYNKKMMRKLFASCDIEEGRIFYWGFILYPLLYLRKLILKLRSKRNPITLGFKPPNRIVNILFDKLLAIENSIIKSPIFGTSLVGFGRIRSSKDD